MLMTAGEYRGSPRGYRPRVFVNRQRERDLTPGVAMTDAKGDRFLAGETEAGGFLTQCAADGKLGGSRQPHPRGGAGRRPANIPGDQDRRGEHRRPFAVSATGGRGGRSLAPAWAIPPDPRPASRNRDPARRSYSLSCAASDGLYRISVKREGAVSGFLHTPGMGDTIEAREPAGAFTLDAHATRLAVLFAAGVTPMIAVPRHILYEGKRTRALRPTWFLFTQELHDELRDAGVPDVRIFAEAFGPASLKRRRAHGDPVVEPPAAARGGSA